MNMLKFRRFIYAAAAALAALAGCEGTEDLGPENVALEGPATIELAQAGQELTLNLTATVDWQVKGYTDDVKAWLTITPDQGKAAKGVQTITIKALANNDSDRKASLEFYGNILAKAPLTITQKGSKLPGEGTLESPFNAAEANAVASALAADVPTDKEVYVKGKICSVKECSPQFGNTSFYITDDGNDSEDKFYVYRVKYLGGAKITAEDQMKVGDEVIVRAKLVNYKGNTPETQQGGVIVSHNGKVDDSGAGPGSGSGDYQNAPVKTVAELIALADQTNYYRLTGEVSGFNSKYCSFDLKDETGTIYVYSVVDKDDWADKIKNGDTVTLAGKYLWYEHATDASKNKHEVVDAYILSVKVGEGGGSGSGDEYPKEKPALAKVTIADFLQKTVNNTDWYELTGEIISIAKQDFGNFTIKDETGSVYIYGMTSAWIGAANDKSFASIGLSVGDKVTLGTLRQEYDGTAQGGGSWMAAFYISHEKGETKPISVSHPLTSNVTWTLGDKSYDEKVQINGSEYAALKLGTSSVVGEATIAIPASAKKLSFFAVSWNNKDGQLEILDGEKVIKTIDPARNPAAINNSPYRFETLADTDFYTVETAGATSIKVRTVASKTRVILFGVNAE